ncbi:MAG: hypothetical protein KAJ95_01145, partial [Gammaproteobacteria bacterium]|nr:hypothetical protein [Gammaproteobacteria bacterium]
MKLNYSDEDLTFLMGMYRDRERAMGALSRVRKHYPDASVIVRSDGDYDPMNHELAELFDVEYFAEERLYPIEHGGAMVARTLQLFLDKPTRYLVKIDTDTAVNRRFHSLPEINGIYGRIQTNKEGLYPSVQGGCIIFSHEAVRKIIDSDILQDPRLKDPWAFQEDSGYLRRMGRRATRCGLCSYDWMIGWAAHELQIPMVSFSEVNSRAKLREHDKDEDLRYAITHP